MTPESDFPTHPQLGKWVRDYRYNHPRVVCVGLFLVGCLMLPMFMFGIAFGLVIGAPESTTIAMGFIAMAIFAIMSILYRRRYFFAQPPVQEYEGGLVFNQRHEKSFAYAWKDLSRDMRNNWYARRLGITTSTGKVFNFDFLLRDIKVLRNKVKVLEAEKRIKAFRNGASAERSDAEKQLGEWIKNYRLSMSILVADLRSPKFMIPMATIVVFLTVLVGLSTSQLICHAMLLIGLSTAAVITYFALYHNFDPMPHIQLYENGVVLRENKQSMTYMWSDLLIDVDPKSGTATLVASDGTEYPFSRWSLEGYKDFVAKAIVATGEAESESLKQEENGSRIFSTNSRFPFIGIGLISGSFPILMIPVGVYLIIAKSDLLTAIILLPMGLLGLWVIRFSYREYRLYITDVVITNDGLELTSRAKHFDLRWDEIEAVWGSEALRLKLLNGEEMSICFQDFDFGFILRGLMIDFLYERILQRFLDKIQSGKSVDFKYVSITSEGVIGKNQTLSWADLRQIADDEDKWPRWMVPRRIGEPNDDFILALITIFTYPEKPEQYLSPTKQDAENGYES